jgi:hypothetical protein
MTLDVEVAESIGLTAGEQAWDAFLKELACSRSFELK